MKTKVAIKGGCLCGRVRYEITGPLVDADMHDLSLVLGNSPKVIWLRLGNCSTLQVENVLRRDFNAIKLFYEDKILSLLALS